MSKIDTSSATAAASRQKDGDRVPASDISVGKQDDRLVDGETAFSVPVLAEELVVETRQVAHGMLRVHKGVTVEEQSLRVPIVHDQAEIVHLAPDDYAAAQERDPEGLFVPIYAEEIVIEKRLVLREYLWVQKKRVEQEQTVTETVRREYVEIADAEGNSFSGK
jgi:uncharacterized protein (TIGR02271 family)